MGHVVHARQVSAPRAQSAAVSAPDLAALVAHYQRELRLENWRIEATYAPDLADPRSGRPVWGLCFPTGDAKVAKIVIRDPATPPDGETPETALSHVRETVIHELAHLHFAPFGHVAPAEVSAEENAVWAFAEALAKAWGTADETSIARAMVAAIDNVRARVVGPDPKETRKMDLDPKLAAEAVGLLAAKDAKGALDFVQRFVTAALGGKAEPSKDLPEEEPPAAPPAAAVPPPAEGEEEKPKARVVAGPDPLLAFARSVLALVGDSDPSRALAEVARRTELAGQLEAREAAVARDRAALDAAERGKLVARLVELGAETPHTSGLASGVVVKRLADEPIADLRARVTELAAGAPRARVLRAGTERGAHDLTADELDKCKARGIDPEKYAATVAGIRRRSAGQNTENSR